MGNLSKIRREKMIEFLNRLKGEHADDESLIALNQIESELTSKRYGLVWEEHEENVDLMMRDNVPVFTEVKKYELDADTDGRLNFLLEGDNLHSLYLLKKTLKDRVDVVYIDPPYNTGGKNDFVYDDMRVDLNDNYMHSKWCSFILKRLLIAKDVLSTRGLVFISIDDNEYANLKLICDEVFGEKNFVTTCVWQKIHSIKNDAKYFSVNHDYILVYAKQVENIQLNLLNRTEGMDARYKNPDDDPRGPWQSGDLVANEVRTNGNYDVVGPTGKVFNVPEGKHWVYSQDNMNELLADNRIWFGKNGTSFPRKKRFLSEVQSGRTPDTWWKNEEVGHNQEGARDLKKVLGAVEFNNPKPVRLINRVLEIASHSDSIVLDFFAGSGTTAQAVLEMNKTDGGCRSFILCTNNENKICEEITYQRIRTIIEGKRKDGSIFSEGIPAKLKYYRTDFVSKDCENLADVLLAHAAEMIQLEKGVNLDDDKYIMILSDEEADALEKNWVKYTDLKTIYISRDVLLSTKQEKLFNTVEMCIIPDHYFNFELREVGELW